MPRDDELTGAVRDELFWAPKLDSAAVAVSADAGKITLRGTVGSLREKREARQAALRVHGVVSVDNRLEVRLMDDERRADADLRGDVLQALMLDRLVPSTVDVEVEDGLVVLTGTADRQYQREEAERVAADIAGASNVVDDIALTWPTPGADDVQTTI